MELDFILKSLRKKDKKIFQLIFERFYARLVTYSYKFTYDQAASEDLVQEVFIYIWENIQKLEIKISLKAYLYAMVRNRSLNYLKRVDVTDKSYLIDVSISLSEDLEKEIFSEKEMKELTLQAEGILNDLPLKMQEIFKLRVIEGFSYKEIAVELGVSVNTVKTQLKRAKLKIESALLILSILIFLSK